MDKYYAQHILKLNTITVKNIIDNINKENNYNALLTIDFETANNESILDNKLFIANKNTLITNENLFLTLLRNELIDDINFDNFEVTDNFINN